MRKELQLLLQCLLRVVPLVLACHLHVDASSVTHDENNGAENATWNGKDICDIYASMHINIFVCMCLCVYMCVSLAT